MNGAEPQSLPRARGRCPSAHTGADEVLLPDHGETSLRSETSSVSCADSFPLRGEARAAYQSFPRGGRRMRCCPVFPSRAKPWQCGTLCGGTTPPSSGGRNTLDDTSPCAGEVFGLLRASRRARNARRSKLCSAPTAKTGAPALAGATPPAVGAAACPRPAAAFFFK